MPLCGKGCAELVVLGVTAGENVTDRESYLALVYRLGSTGNGVFGAKIHWNNLRWALAKFAEMPRFAGLDRAATLHRAFPNLRVVDVTRRDRVRQAVSWARMAQDGIWVAPAGQPEPAWPSSTVAPRYDYELIAGLEALITEGEAGWRRLYAGLGLTPCHVVYEDLTSPAGYEPPVRRVLAHLDSTNTQAPSRPPRRAANPMT
jgi:trehalose 2-sulfotransferase